jgi:hypothetical protein
MAISSRSLHVSGLIKSDPAVSDPLHVSGLNPTQHESDNG